jgi:hypothetical protein
MTSSGRVNLSKIGGCVLLPLSLNDLAEHEKEEKKRVRGAAHTPRKMTGSGLGGCPPPIVQFC